ncbi:MAG: hypothetical protein A2233_01805 [Candidatus Kerfeldbacteria bacterium RIFOXYA2_FULL_38_24]|uniref:Uncharacterized protein n=1 Tax=Candidatus Kerfeldbacteria bacterium RIFOXYB2_FULL_38_14 TaxID=1798547 RepID=A0A1G2BES8_9BACT|nr:MAG: hypothetical protein A2319_04410 [Candidatus Kerfeldbacteria bacterium RIFOXYB2_FULL_38_14]OGY87853.1 MAG: hypothetical protein A2233_01805 [Candidatus Kerfeldbacteria bacterium RIFOXYA2_FULL_38_24]OGY88508.1 MAG: hypothetical protein A2458_01940 [Candidatus Kerfeldbacteria bacterium RIFOXYC2_FULL_38_9]
MENSTTINLEKQLPLIFLPVTIAIVFQIAILFNQNYLLLTILANIALVFYIILRLNQKSKEKYNWKSRALYGGLAGFISGLVIAVFNFCINLNLVAFFAIFTRSIFSGLLDGIGAGLLFILWQLLKPIKKGGENNE